MATLQKLKDFGWYLNEDGLKKLNEDGKVVDVKELIKRALDADLREISIGGLPTDFGKHAKYDASGSGIILQILKIRNISAPKCNEESKAAPRLLQLDFTDGHTFANGLEFERISVLSLNTPPGTKITLKGSVKIVQGFMLLGPSNIQVCGGVVAPMIEKWESQRALAKYGGGVKMNTSGGGPPPWIPFGQKNQYQSAGKAFQSLNGDKPKEITKETAEFLASRNEAIAEATKLKKRKIFGGGSRQLMDHNVKRIMDKGYSEEEAKLSLKYTRNNVEKAMGNLKRRNDKFSTAEQPAAARSGYVKNSRDDRMGRKGGGKDIDSVESSKPSAQVSLFDFLTDKIKIPQTTANTSSSSYQSTTAVTTTASSISSGIMSNQKQMKSNPFRSSNADNSTRRNAFKSMTDDSLSGRQTNQSTHNKPTSSVSYHEMTTEEQRSKFENNISASFANRRRDDEPSKGEGWGGGYSSRQSTVSTTKSNNQNTNNSYPSNSRFNSNRNTNSAPPPSSSSSNSRQSFVAATNDHFQHSSKSTAKGINRQSSDKTKSMSRYDDNNKVPSSYYQSSTQDKRISASAINQLANETAAMKIYNSKNLQQQHQPQNNNLRTHQQQHYQSQSQTKKNSFEKVFPQMPNGFEYNPYKIMGFQNKETNEFAMTVLKTQNFENIPQINAAATPIAMPNNIITSPQPQQMQMPDAFISMQNFSKPPPPLASQPQQHHQQQQQHYIAASPAGVGQLQQQTMIGASVPYNWNWKCNDVCFAKYWEDGRYYHAEITGMSDKTCVVQFMEYGNFEEVLLTDCLPITDGNIKLINQYNANLMQPQAMHYAGSQQSSSTGPQSMQHQQQHTHRAMRNDQQMYMPPAQRSNK